MTGTRDHLLGRRGMGVGLCLVCLLMALASGCASPATPEPTITPVPTATPPPTATPVPTFAMNEALQSDQWGISVIAAVNRGSEFTVEDAFGLGTQTMTHSVPEAHFVLVTVTVEALGDQHISASLQVRPVLVDAARVVYPLTASGVPGGYIDYSQDVAENVTIPQLSPVDLDYVYIVPDGVGDLFLEWPDIGAIWLAVTGGAD
jgi:hypothetical protein